MRSATVFERTEDEFAGPRFYLEEGPSPLPSPALPVLSGTTSVSAPVPAEAPSGLVSLSSFAGTPRAPASAPAATVAAAASAPAAPTPAAAPAPRSPVPSAALVAPPSSTSAARSATAPQPEYPSHRATMSSVRRIAAAGQSARSRPWFGISSSGATGHAGRRSCRHCYVSTASSYGRMTRCAIASLKRRQGGADPASRVTSYALM